MSDLKEAIDTFLAQQPIAVAGVSRQDNLPGNLIYRKLRDAGYRVVAVNPRTDTTEGDPCYPDLAAVPGSVRAVMIATPPAAAEALVRQCADLSIGHVWLHRSVGAGSVSPQAVAFCRERGIAVIPGACPMMFCAPVDPAHRCMRWVLGLTGGLPKPIAGE